MLSEEQTGIFKALSDQNRLKIVNALRGRTAPTESFYPFEQCYFELLDECL